MTTLFIRYPEAPVPISLTVVNDEGGVVIAHAGLSSAQRQLEVPGLPPGDYFLLVTEATGATATRRVAVSSGVNSVDYDLQIDAGRRGPHFDFETDLDIRSRFNRTGLITNANLLPYISLTRQLSTAQTFSGSAGRALQAIVRAERQPKPSREADDDFGLEPERDGRKSFNQIPAGPTPPPGVRHIALRSWIWDERWRETTDNWSLRPNPPVQAITSTEIVIGVDECTKPQAFAVTDQTGSGPIVIAPPFRRGLELTFLAAGLSAADAADRVANPSALRVPVAVARPREAGLADLLAGLSSAALPGASDLLQAQFRAAGDPSTTAALERLLHKSDDPTAAVLAAHYLLRFAPEMLPVAWLQNLSRMLPEVADVPTLLAWRYITAGPDQGQIIDNAAVQALFRVAARLPVTYFSRARALLSQGQRLYGPWTRRRRTKIATPRALRAGDFLDLGADAGGLEAFWGTSPGAPLGTGRPGRTDRVLPQIILDNGYFH